jgi:twitching motility protein PilT
MSYTNPIHPYLHSLVACEGSDLHLVPEDLPRLRADGRLMPVARDEKHGIGNLSAEDVRMLIEGTMPDPVRERWNVAKSLDYSYDAGPELGRYRVNAFRQQRGPAAVLRRVPPPPDDMDALGLPQSVRALTARPNGLVVIAAPTGGGKSTTMAALINEVNQRRAGHIVTLEDPVEFAHANRGCIVTQREVGTDVHSYAEGVESLLRQDPDVVMLGEVRTATVLREALAVAETGHLVFTTIHAQSAPGAVARVVGLEDAGRQEATRRQLAGVMQGVVAQALLPRVGGGRVAAFEVLLRTTATVNRIAEGRFDALRNDLAVRSTGMVLLERSLAELVVRGEVTSEEAAMWANDPDQFWRELAALTSP